MQKGLQFRVTKEQGLKIVAATLLKRRNRGNSSVKICCKYDDERRKLNKFFNKSFGKDRPEAS
jgi:hypothetical protein